MSSQTFNITLYTFPLGWFHLPVGIILNSCKRIHVPTLPSRSTSRISRRVHKSQQNHYVFLLKKHEASKLQENIWHRKRAEGYSVAARQLSCVGYPWLILSFFSVIRCQLFVSIIFTSSSARLDAFWVIKSHFIKCNLFFGSVPRLIVLRLRLRQWHVKVKSRANNWKDSLINCLIGYPYLSSACSRRMSFYQGSLLTLRRKMFYASLHWNSFENDFSFRPLTQSKTQHTTHTDTQAKWS